MKRLLLLALPACVSVPDGPAPMCESNADCDTANGEICDDGVCWGNPPPGTFAAIVTPPPSSSITSLTSRELASVAIHQDGWIDQVQLEKPLLYSTSLACKPTLMCDTTLLAATITVTRASTFPGGPGFRAVVKTKNGELFKIAVPPPHDGPSTYQITIVPDGRDEMASQTTPAQVLPPLRTSLTIEGNASGKIIELGDYSYTVAGTIKNSANIGEANYRVVAIGRWDAGQAPTEVSTVDFTGTDGTFQIMLSSNLQPDVEIVAIPLVNKARPTLRYTGAIGTTGAQNLSLAWPPAVGGPQLIEIPVRAVDGNGEVKPARGAKVIISAKTQGVNAEASYLVDATTDDNGNARLTVLDGTAFRAGYRISIVPSGTSTSGSIHNQPFAISPIAIQQLKTRIALKGFVALGGVGVKDMSVTARPSLKFVWNLDLADQAFVTALPPSTAVTPESGEFIIWVDQPPPEQWGYYDITFEPASGSNAPNVTYANVPVAPMAAPTTVPIGVYDLPYPAYVRSVVVDDKGDSVEGAELKLYKTEDFGTLCREVLHPPTNCTSIANTATLMGRGTSDKDGEVRLTLPR